MDREAWRAIVHGERVRHDWATNTFHSELTNENTVLWIHIYSFTSLPHNSGRRQWQPTPVLLPGKSQGRRSLVGYSQWGREESDTTKRLRFHFSLSCTGEGNGNPLQCSCLENPRDGGAWWAAVYGVAQGQTRLKWLGSSSHNSVFCLVFYSLTLLLLFYFWRGLLHCSSVMVWVQSLANQLMPFFFSHIDI